LQGSKLRPSEDGVASGFELGGIVDDSVTGVEIGRLAEDGSVKGGNDARAEGGRMARGGEMGRCPQRTSELRVTNGKRGEWIE